MIVPKESYTVWRVTGLPSRSTNPSCILSPPVFPFRLDGTTSRFRRGWYGVQNDPTLVASVPSFGQPELAPRLFDINQSSRGGIVSPRLNGLSDVDAIHHIVPRRVGHPVA